MSEQTIIDPGMWSNLTAEFKTVKVEAWVVELYEARSMLASECEDMRGERNEAIADVRELQAEAADLRADRDAAREHTTEMRNTLQDVRQQLDDARVVVAQVTEANEFLANAAGTAAAERDRARERLREVSAELAHQQDAYDHARANLLMEAAIADRLYLANLRLKRAALRLYGGRNDARAWAGAWKRCARGWREAAHEAQDAQTSGPRDADVAALVRAVDEWVRRFDSWSDNDDWVVEAYERVVAALRPFRRVAVPVLGDVEDHNGLQNHVAWRMTPERRDAAMPRALEGEGE